MPTIDTTPPTQAQPLPTAQPAPAFLAYYAPSRWMVPVGTSRLVPDLVKVPIEPGYGAVGEQMRGRWGAAVDAVTSDKRGSGHTLLPLSDLLDGEQYIVKHEVRVENSNRTRYGFAWEVLKVGTDGVREDAAVMDRWLDLWRSKGLVPALPEIEVVNAALADLERQEETALRGAQGRETPAVRAIRAEAAVWRKAQEAILAPEAATGAEEAKPARAAKRKAAVDVNAAPDVGSGFVDAP